MLFFTTIGFRVIGDFCFGCILSGGLGTLNNVGIAFWRFRRIFFGDVNCDISKLFAHKTLDLNKWSALLSNKSCLLEFSTHRLHLSLSFGNRKNDIPLLAIRLFVQLIAEHHCPVFCFFFLLDTIFVLSNVTLFLLLSNSELESVV